jgi:septal ring factor EnvC (AmiA/AmiB activator)
MKSSKSLIKFSRKCIFYVGLLLFVTLTPSLPSFAQQNQSQNKLQELQQELKTRQQRLATNKATADELEAILKKSETEIGRVAKALNSTEQTLAHNRSEQAALKQRQQTLVAAISQQQSLLASQLKSAFMAGHYDYAKMIFYQDDASAFERVLTYYQYLNKARQDKIVLFRDTVDELKLVNASLAAKESQLASLLQTQIQQQDELTARQNDRKQTLAKLSKDIATDEAKIDDLRKAEQALIAAIEKAQREAIKVTDLHGLAAAKGKLLRPASGTVRKLFGKRRQGQVRWKGIVIEGREGSAVKAIANGRVIYADWLRGFGLVSVIDHGNGYMSVYGHNQALLKQAGDMIAQGETVALLGQSGGQSSPNLYFEIRHKGKAMNPSSWVRW